MEDAVVLANCLYDIGTTSPEDINAALKSFKDQRYPHVIEQYKASKVGCLEGKTTERSNSETNDDISGLRTIDERKVSVWPCKFPSTLSHWYNPRVLPQLF